MALLREAMPRPASLGPCAAGVAYVGSLVRGGGGG